MPPSPAGREHRFNLVHPRFGGDSISLLRAMRRFASVANHLRLAAEELRSIHDDLALFFPCDGDGMAKTAEQFARQFVAIDEVRDEVDEISMRLALDDESQRDEGERSKLEAEEEVKRDKEDCERLADSEYREQSRFSLRRIQANAFSIQRMRLDIDETIVGGKSLRWWLKMGLI